MSLNELAKECHRVAVQHGWYERARGPLELIALCHSELSEAVEEFRNNRMDTRRVMVGKNVFQPEGFGIECADSIIRILDMCAYLDIDIDACVNEKMEYNRTRDYRHGGKQA